MGRRWALGGGTEEEGGWMGASQWVRERKAWTGGQTKRIGENRKGKEGYSR